MTDTMQALYRYTAEGRFSSYLTGADYREVCRVLDKMEQTLRQLLPAGERDLLSRLETARLEQRDLELEAMFQAAWTAAQEVPCNLRPRACPRRTAKRPRPSFGPPPQRPFRRQCRSAASRTAGTPDSSRQPTGDPRPPSHRPGQGPGRGRSPFLVSAAVGGGKKRIIFRRGMYVTKNSSHGAECHRHPPGKAGAGPAPKAGGRKTGSGHSAPPPRLFLYPISLCANME